MTSASSAHLDRTGDEADVGLDALLGVGGGEELLGELGEGSANSTAG